MCGTVPGEGIVELPPLSLSGPVCRLSYRHEPREITVSTVQSNNKHVMLNEN